MLEYSKVNDEANEPCTCRVVLVVASCKITDYNIAIRHDNISYNELQTKGIDFHRNLVSGIWEKQLSLCRLKLAVDCKTVGGTIKSQIWKFILITKKIPAVKKAVMNHKLFLNKKACFVNLICGAIGAIGLHSFSKSTYNTDCKLFTSHSSKH